MGGSGGYLNPGLEPVGGSTAAQSWDGGQGRQQPQQQQPAQDGYQQQPVQQDQPYSGNPGASYERPDAGYDRPAPQQQTYQQPQQQRQPQQAYRQPQPQPQQQSDGYPDPAAGATGPASTSRPGAQRHDEVGYAGVRGVAGGDNGSVVMVHRTLPAGSFVEVTSLETGKTIIMLVTGSMEGSDHLADLSPAAAQLLGGSSQMIPVRVRTITPTGGDQAALLAGRPATERPDTPPVLLNALRKQLPAASTPRAASTQPSYGRPVTQPARPAASTGHGAGFYVQIGAFSNQANANGLAQSLGGFVRPGGGLYRVQMGPYRTAGEAQAARAEAARRGYGDAKVLQQN